MAFEDIKAEIYLALQKMTDQPEDAHELARQIHERIAELRATGMPVPQDLVDLEKRLERDLGTKPRGGDASS